MGKGFVRIGGASLGKGRQAAKIYPRGDACSYEQRLGCHCLDWG